MKKLLLLFLLLPSLLWASPPTSSFTYAAGSLIQPSEVQQNEANIYNYLSTGVDTIYDGSIVNADINASAAIGYSKLSLGSSILSSDIKDGEIVNSDISSSAAIADSKLAQITTASKVSATAITGGVVLPSGAIFFMITGSCPTGTTDVTSTYSDKFIMINATQNTTGTGAGSTDNHTLTIPEMPSHSHSVVAGGASGTASRLPVNPDVNLWVDFPTSSTGGGGAHNHTITNYRPAYVTCKMCQVN